MTPSQIFAAARQRARARLLTSPLGTSRQRELLADGGTLLLLLLSGLLLWGVFVGGLPR